VWNAQRPWLERGGLDVGSLADRQLYREVEVDFGQRHLDRDVAWDEGGLRDVHAGLDTAHRERTREIADGVDELVRRASPAVHGPWTARSPGSGERDLRSRRSGG
jgi:hypothetical protein